MIAAVFLISMYESTSNDAINNANNSNESIN